MLDYFGHGEGFARAGDAEQHLVLFAVFDAAHQFRNGLGLVTPRLVIARESKVHGSCTGNASPKAL